MEPRIPDVEFFIAMKWMFILMVTSALATFASLIVKRLWYGNGKHNRRSDDDTSRGLLERFFDLKKETNKATLDLTLQIQLMHNTLKDNGDLLKDAIKEWNCNYHPKSRMD